MNTTRYIRNKVGSNPDTLTITTFAFLVMQLICQILTASADILRRLEWLSDAPLFDFYNIVRLNIYLWQNNALIVNQARWYMVLRQLLPGDIEAKLRSMRVMMGVMFALIGANFVYNGTLLGLILHDNGNALKASFFGQAAVVHPLIIASYFLIYLRLRRTLGRSSKLHSLHRGTAWFFIFVAQYLAFQSANMLASNNKDEG